MANNQQKVFAEMMKTLGMAENVLLTEKAGGIYDLISLKSAGMVVNDAAKTILSLDISCELLGIPFDTATAANHSSMRKTAYVNNRKIFMKLMNLNKKTDINDLIMKRGISNPHVAKTAHNIYEAYKKYAEGADFDHPQYMTMCVFQACKLEGVKIAKKDFIGSSNLKPNQWTQLEKVFEKVAASVGKLGKENENNKVQADDNVVSTASDPKLKRKADMEPEIEDYDVWAKRTLDKALAEIAANEV